MKNKKINSFIKSIFQFLLADLRRHFFQFYSQTNPLLHIRTRISCSPSQRNVIACCRAANTIYYLQRNFLVSSFTANKLPTSFNIHIFHGDAPKRNWKMKKNIECAWSFVCFRKTNSISAKVIIKVNLSAFVRMSSLYFVQPIITVFL